MNENQRTNNIDFTVNQNNLYREVMFTDLKVASIKKLIPINSDGTDDKSRPVMFIGETQIMTPGGALPLSFGIEAEDLAGAVDAFGEEARKAVERTMEELKELQRQQASSIVVPGREGSKIQLP